MTAAIVILAGGVGTRVGAPGNKVLLEVAGESMVSRCVRTALTVPDVARIVVVVRPDDRDAVTGSLQPILGDREVWLVDGGVERHHSEWHALRTLAEDIESGAVSVVALHDAARPLASADLFAAAISAAAEHGGAIPVRRADHLITAQGDAVGELAGVQTPQAFQAGALLDSYRRAEAEGTTGTDTAATVARYSDLRTVAIEGEATNLKVTYPEDVAVAETLIRPRSRD